MVHQGVASKSFVVDMTRSTPQQLRFEKYKSTQITDSVYKHNPNDIKKLFR